MDFLRLAIATTGLAGSLRESLGIAAGSGAQGVQFDLRQEVTADEFGVTACQELRHLLDERSLKIASASFPLRRPLHDPVEIDGRVNVVRKAIELCGRLQCRVLTLRTGRIPDEADTAARARLEGALGDLARLGARHGVTPAISTSGDTAESLAGLVHSIKDGPVAIDLDPAGCITSGLDPVTQYRSLHSLICHVQGRDAIRDLESGGLEVSLGRGETRWDELLANLADARYPGWITVRRTTGDQRVRDLLNAIQYLRNVASGG